MPNAQLTFWELKKNSKVEKFKQCVTFSIGNASSTEMI